MATLQAIREQLAATRAQLQASPHQRGEHRPRPPMQVQIHESEGPEHSSDRVRMVPPEALLLDPPRFQFRLSAGVDGTSGRLQGCPVFTLELCGALLGWIDPADGSGPWLIDGHHRRALAMADGAPLVPVLLVKAATAEEARALGALSNVANGTATPQDLCRLLRDQQLDPRTLSSRYGLKRHSRTVADARTLLALDGDLFGRCCTGELELEQALALAAAPEHTLQRRLWAMALERCWEPAQTQEAVALALLAPTRHEVPAGCLPGLEALMADANPMLDEQLSVRACIRRSLRVEHRGCKIVGSHRTAAALERRGVAAVDLEQAQTVKAESGALLEVFSRLAGCSGPLAELIARLAAQVADGADPVRVVDQQMDQIRAILTAELG